MLLSYPPPFSIASDTGLAKERATFRACSWTALSTRFFGRRRVECRGFEARGLVFGCGVGGPHGAATGPRSARASGGGETIEEDEPPEVVDEIGHADLGFRPGDADGSDEEVHLVLLHGEDVFDAGADFGLERVGVPRRLRHGPARRLLAMDAADEPVLFEERLIGLRAVGRVGSDGARGVGLVEQPLTQPRALVGRSVGRVPAP